MTVKEIFDFLNLKYPVSTACDFDNPGILAGDPNTAVTKAVIALDCTPAVLKTAAEKGCELIITHHPVIFNPLKRVCSDSVIFRLIKNGVSVISMHTNLDVGQDGVNDSLCGTLSLRDVKKHTAEDGYLLNCALLPSPLSAQALAEYIGKRLGGHVRYSSGFTGKISRVLVCSGSGGNYLGELGRSGCDALITADVKHNVFIDAEFLGKAVFDAGHFETEDVITEPLKRILEQNFKSVQFFTEHTLSIKYI